MSKKFPSLTYVDSYGNSHIIHNFGDNTIHEAMRELILVLRYAGFAESTIQQGLDNASLDF